ncbi:hypothetical protein FEP59_03240 [Burkholderia multivorans]|nr:hypothetical protein [Burkholderia multivorans]
MALFYASRTLSVSGAALPTYGGQSLLTPVKLTGAETIGELFEYVLELKTPDALAFSPSIAANVDLDALIGTEVTVSIQLEGRGHFIPGLAGGADMGNIGAGMREITGIVSQATIVREDGRSIVYALTLRPWLWHATKNCGCRIFQDMSVVEITDAVLSAYPFPVDKRLTTPRPNKVWPKRDIQRQHFESDWAFLQRLWEEWGIYYFSSMAKASIGSCFAIRWARSGRSATPMPSFATNRRPVGASTGAYSRILGVTCADDGRGDGCRLRLHVAASESDRDARGPSRYGPRPSGALFVG